MTGDWKEQKKWVILPMNWLLSLSTVEGPDVPELLWKPFHLEISLKRWKKIDWLET